MGEKAFYVKNNMNQWVAIVASLTEPKHHLDKIWIEQYPDEVINELEQLGLEYQLITRLYTI